MHPGPLFSGLGINIETVIQNASDTGCVLQHDVLMPVIIDIELRRVDTPTKVVERERPIDGSEFFVLIVFQFTKVLHILIKEIQHGADTRLQPCPSPDRTTPQRQSSAQRETKL